MHFHAAGHCIKEKEEWNRETTQQSPSASPLRVLRVHLICAADPQIRIRTKLDGSGKAVTPSTPTGETTRSDSAITSYPPTTAAGAPYAGRKAPPDPWRRGTVEVKPSRGD